MGAAEEVDVTGTEVPKFEHVEWTKEPHLRKLYLLSVVLMVASATTGYDGMLVNNSQMMDLWEEYFGENVQDDDKLGLLVNMFNIGSIIAFFIVPFVADHYGRKLAIVIGCLLMTLGGCLSAFCNDYGMYIAGRFVLGFGNSFAQMSSPLLLTEIAHPQHRGPVTTIYNCLWNLGAFLVACIAWGTSNINNNWCWRLITLFQIVPSLIQLAFIWFVPESPRYLISRDRNEEALAILSKYHAGGDERNATVQFEYREIKQTIHAEAEAARQSSFGDFFRSRGNIWRLAIVISLGLISQYSGNAMFSNYMDPVYEGAGIVEQNKKLGLTVGKTALDVIVTITAALQVDRFGRRPLFLTAVSGMTLCFAICTALGAEYDKGNDAAGIAQVAFIWLFGVFYDIGFSGLLVAYALEVLPFRLRAKGMMILNISIQAFLALSNQTNKKAWNNFPQHWNFMLFYTLWDCIEAIFVFFVYVETKGPTLEEIARIFDGDKAAAPHMDVRQIEKEMMAERDEGDLAHEEVTRDQN